VGSKLKDNDPRCAGRVLTVTEVLPNGVAAKDLTGRSRLYLLQRIHTDGKPRRSGLSLIE
jgi:hypothetical protein